jgi:hypothetical protein
MTMVTLLLIIFLDYAVQTNTFTHMQPILVRHKRLRLPDLGFIEFNASD